MRENILNIGIVIDDPSYVEWLETYLRSRSKQLLTINPQQVNLDSTETVKPLLCQGTQIDRLVIYGHFGKGHRQKLDGVRWLRDFRLAGYATPIVLLVWERPSRVWARNFAENIFVSPNYEDSCRILQLPVLFELLFEELLAIQHLSHDKLIEGRSFALCSWLGHRLTYIWMIDNLQEGQAQIKKLKDDLPYSKKEVEFLEQLLQCSNILNFKNSIKDYLQRH